MDQHEQRKVLGSFIRLLTLPECEQIQGAGGLLALFSPPFLVYIRIKVHRVVLQSTEQKATQQFLGNSKPSPTAVSIPDGHQTVAAEFPALRWKSTRERR